MINRVTNCFGWKFWFVLLLMLVSSASESRALLSPSTSLDSVQARQLWLTGDSLYEHSAYEKAIQKLKKAHNYLYRTGQTKAYYSCLNTLGTVLLMNERFKEGERYIRKALKRHKSDKEKYYKALADAYNNLAYLYKHAPYYLNNEQAITYYKKAITTYEENVEEDEGELAKLYSNIAFVYYKNGKLDKAQHHVEQVVILPADSARTLNNAQAIQMLAKVYLKKGYSKKALEYYKSALSIFKELKGKNYYGVALMYHRMGNIYKQRRDFIKAKDYFSLAIAIFQKTLGKHHQTANGFASLGMVEYWLGDNQGALENFKQAKQMLDELNLSDTRDYISILHNIASIYTSVEKHQKALKYLRRCLQKRNKLGLGIASDDNITYNKLGSTYLKVGKIDSARLFQQRCIDSSREKFGSHYYQVAYGYLGLANVYEAQNHYKKALRQVQMGLASCFPEFEWNTLNRNPQMRDYEKWEIVFKLLIKKGQLLKDLANSAKKVDTATHKHAYRTFMLATSLIDTVKDRYRSRKTIQFLYENARKAYARGIAHGFRLYEMTGDASYKHEVYRLFGKNKSVLLRKNLKKSKARRFAGIPDSLTRKEQTLEEDISYYKSQIEESSKKSIDSAVREKYQHKIAQTRKKLSTLKERFRKNYPKYFRLMHNDQSLTLREIQTRILKSNEALVEYFNGFNNYYYMFLSPDTSIIGHIPKDSSFEQALTFMINSIKKPDTLVKRFVNRSHRLYKALFGDIKGLASKKNLHIIPDGKLVYLPFDALVQNKPDQNACHYNMLSYMIRDHKLNYAYSNTLIRDAGEAVESKSLNYVAFAPSFDSKRSIVDSQFSQLQGATEELNALSYISKGKKQQGNQATESRFKQKASAYDIIHMATHAIVNEQNPLNSSMILASSDSSTEDGRLHAWEVFNMKLNAELAALSACNTGSGKLMSGEGVVSIGRSFAYAGCTSLLISLWRVHDQVSVKLMDKFYRSIHNGASKHAALRSAKLDYLSSADGLTAHPFYWASFITIGQPDPISTSPSHMNTNYMIGGIIMLILFLISAYLWYRKIS